MTTQINSLFFECFQNAAQELHEEKELKALLLVLEHASGRPGLVTDKEAFNKTVSIINDKLRNI